MKELIESLKEAIKLQAKRDKAFSDCDGSWGYYGYHIEEELKIAHVRCKKAINNIIDERLK